MNLHAVPRPSVTRRTLAGVLIAVTVAGCARRGAAPAPADQSIVLVSIDGFRSEYFDDFETPHLHALAAAGVRARWMQPSFPVLTFPNHYTIVTGLTPAHHGIVNNTIVDPHDPARFRMQDTVQVRRGMWWGGEPIWSTAELQGVRTASFYWPGSEATIRGAWPTFWKKYDEEVPAAARVDTVLAWLTRADTLRPRFAAVYFSMVDHAGHDFGPAAPETRAAVLSADSAIGRLVGGLRAAGLADRVNIIVVADHGMAATRRDRVVLLDSLVTMANVDITGTGAFIALSPRNGDTTGLLQALRRSPRLHVYRADSTPERWRYAGNPRIAAVVGVPDEGWLLNTAAWMASHPDMQSGGAHGFEPADTSMHALFVAAGPAFRRGLTAAPFRNVHVYELMCFILGLRPAPNDGSLDSLRALLR